MAFSRFRKGQSLLEVMVAIALLVLIAGSGFTVIATSFRESLAGNQQVRARQILSEGLAAVRQMRNADYTSLTAGVHGLALSGGSWTFTGASDVTESVYTRTVAVTQVDANQSDVTVNVSWNPLPGRTATVSAVTRVTNRLVAPVPPNGSHCTTASVTGNWANPVAGGSIDMGPGNQGTDVAVKGNDVFLSGVAASSAKPDLYVYDATNIASIQNLATVDIGSGGINALSLVGNYLYAASANDSKEFIAFDVTNPASPTVVGSVDLPGSADGLSVLADAHWAVVGRANSAAANVVFYDVTNPAVPSAVASFSEAGNINNFSTDGRYVYAVSDASAANLIIYDLATPNAPKRVASFSLPANSDNVSVAYDDPNMLLVGNENNYLSVLDVTDRLHPFLVSSYNVGGQIQKIACVTGNLGFVASTNTTGEFSVLNIGDLRAIKPYATFNFPQVATGAVFSNNRVYISVRSNDALRIVVPGP